MSVHLIGCLSLFAFYHLGADLFRNQLFKSTSRVSNSLDPDHVLRSVRPNLDQNCLQRLSTDGPSKQRVNLNRRPFLKISTKGTEPICQKLLAFFLRFFLSPQLIYRGDLIGYLKGN